ncbi:MAG: hypothetical protein IPI67_03515 [Myxococcales bacterium]|nr:hypothetical protein [Myxococcales bacterium]
MRQGVWVLLAAVIAACGSEDGARKSPPNANVSVSDFRQNRVDKIDVLPRQLIFSGNDTPAAGSGVFVACTGAAGADPGP